jgi:hypothetical protein
MMNQLQSSHANILGCDHSFVFIVNDNSFGQVFVILFQNLFGLLLLLRRCVKVIHQVHIVVAVTAHHVVEWIEGSGLLDLDRFFHFLLRLMIFHLAFRIRCEEHYFLQISTLDR